MVLKHRKKGTKVTRKPKKHIGVRIRNKIGLDFIKDEWDHTKSPSDNLAAFGLNADPNRTFESSKNALGRKTKPKDPNAESAAFVGLASIPRDDFSERNDRRRIMSEEKQTYAANCIKKHGLDNYAKMAMDIKTNFQQLPEKQLSTLCEKFIALEGKDRLVAVPKPTKK
jgi:hypothetical protein